MSPHRRPSVRLWVRRGPGAGWGGLGFARRGSRGVGLRRWRRSGERARGRACWPLEPLRSAPGARRPAGPGLLPCGPWACGDARRFLGTPWPPGRLLAALVAERAAAVWPWRCQGAETLAGDGCRVHSACPTWQVVRREQSPFLWVPPRRSGGGGGDRDAVLEVRGGLACLRAQNLQRPPGGL